MKSVTILSAASVDPRDPGRGVSIAPTRAGTGQEITAGGASGGADVA